MFTPNYPTYGTFEVLPIPARTGALQEYTGRGVVIAFIDSGFFPHPDLTNRILIHVDATTNHIVESKRFYQARDYSWHGQMTTVIASGDGRKSGGKYRGIASDAELVLIKVSTPQGRLKEADILRGMRWLVDNHARFGIRIVNISVGGDRENHDPENPLHQTVRRLNQSGISVVIAAGNSGKRLILPPASAPEGITVGGFDDRNSLDRSIWRGYNSNYGQALDGSAKPDVVAPACWIASPILPGSYMEREARWLSLMMHARDEMAVRQVLMAAYLDLSLAREQVIRPDKHVFDTVQARIATHKIIDAHHQHVDGTSVSTAIVSSVVAQMIEANPRLTPQAIKSILKSTARRLPIMGETQQGAGMVDPAAAVRTALEQR